MRFLHTGDWQLGMTRHFLAPEAQARFAEAREQVIRRIGEVARDQRAEFVVVAGDVFETNRVGRRTLVRALDAMGSVPVPVYLLPGNHDPWDAASVFRSREFSAHCPGNVHVLNSTEPVAAGDDVEVVGVPWPSKRPGHDLVASVLASLPPVSRRRRVLVAHGQVEAMGARDATEVISLKRLEAEVEAGRLHYVALGDHHSTQPIGPSGAVWYAGAPEATDYDEQDPGNVLVVDLSGRPPQVTPVHVGTWRFVEQRLDVGRGDAARTVAAWLNGLDDKARTIVNVSFRGTIGVLDWAEVEAALDSAREVFGAIDRHPDHDALAILPDGDALTRLDLAGFQRTAFERLRTRAAGEDPERANAQAALALLYRLATAAEARRH